MFKHCPNFTIYTIELVAVTFCSLLLTSADISTLLISPELLRVTRTSAAHPLLNSLALGTWLHSGNNSSYAINRKGLLARHKALWASNKTSVSKSFLQIPQVYVVVSVWADASCTFMWVTKFASRANALLHFAHLCRFSAVCTNSWFNNPFSLTNDFEQNSHS